MAARPTPLPRALVLLGGAAAAVVVAAGLHAAAWLVAPVFLALVIVIMIHPLRGRLAGLGLPGWAATAVLVALVLGVTAVLAWLGVVAVAQLATVLPEYADEIDALVVAGTGALREWGVGSEQLRAVAASLSFAKVAGLVGGFVLGIAAVLADLALVLSLLLFLCIESSSAGARLALIARGRRATGDALRGFTGSTRRFLAVTTVIGLATGLVDAVVLALLGIPAAILWGLLVFVTNYIPYLGFWIAVGPPAVLALLVGGWPLFAVVLAVFLVVNFVLTSLVQPYFVGDVVGVSVTVTVVALVLWGWLLGPVGAVLAVPLTLLAKAVLVDGDPRALWAEALLGSSKRVRLLAAGPLPAAGGRRAGARAVVVGHRVVRPGHRRPRGLSR